MPVPRLALTRQEAAEALGMGLTSFEQYVQPHIRAVRQGKLRLFPVGELERWLEENAAMALGGPPSGGTLSTPQMENE
jgi:excisionase family DNA binding protein